MCGVLGFFGVLDPVNVTRDMMIALQKRGEQGAGAFFAKSDGEIIGTTASGLTPDLFNKLNDRIGLDTLRKTHLIAGVGQLRYGTAGNRSSVQNTQPMYMQAHNEELYLAHNGDTPLYDEQRKLLSERGAVFQSDSDTEFILHHIAAANGATMIDRIIKGLIAYEGTYSVVILLRDADGVRLVAARDPSGNRPLVLGRLGGGYVVASESNAFEIIGADYVREIDPGEVLVISKNGFIRHTAPKAHITHPKKCKFELIYFSFPTSRVFDIPVGMFREALGRKAAERFGHLVRPGDVMTSVPDSGEKFWIGFLKALKLPPDKILIRRHSTDMLRSFTQASHDARLEAMRLKISIEDEALIAGKRIWTFDDSNVRGNAARRIARLLKKYNATWVGMLFSAAPIIGDCGKGIDHGDNLVASGHVHGDRIDAEAIRNAIDPVNIDYIGYNTIQDMREVLAEFGKDPDDFCSGCFEGNEPIWNVW
jgi:amidophosphoribosyltransferase